MLNMTKESLENLATNRLLAIRNKLYKKLWVHSFDGSGCTCRSCMYEWDSLGEVLKEIDLVKSVLKDREHIEKKKSKRRNLEPYTNACPMCKAKPGQRCKFSDWEKKHYEAAKKKNGVHKVRELNA